MTTKELAEELEALKDDHTELKDANTALQDRLARFERLEEELLDYKRTVRAVGVLVDLHEHKYPQPPQKTAEDFYNQFGPLIEASDGIRDWLVDYWPKVVKILNTVGSLKEDKEALLELEQIAKNTKVVDPSSRLLELDKALNTARGYTIQVRPDGQ